jgi:hypothetical protein
MGQVSYGALGPLVGSSHDKRCRRHDYVPSAWVLAVAYGAAGCGGGPCRAPTVRAVGTYLIICFLDQVGSCVERLGRHHRLAAAAHPVPTRPYEQLKEHGRQAAPRSPCCRLTGSLAGGAADAVAVSASWKLVGCDANEGTLSIATDRLNEAARDGEKG